MNKMRPEFEMAAESALRIGQANLLSMGLANGATHVVPTKARRRAEADLRILETVQSSIGMVPQAFIVKLL